MEIAGPQIKQFLNTRTCVVEQGEQQVIPFSAPGEAVYLSQKVTKFLFVQVTEDGVKRLLRGDGHNWTT